MSWRGFVLLYVCTVILGLKIDALAGVTRDIWTMLWQ